MMLWWLLSLFVFPFLHNAWAQTNASCLPFYSWAFNSEKESPCQVASSLLAVCSNSGTFPVIALPPQSHYLGPSLQNANPCQCNTVTYSMMSACGACQGQTYLSWSVWSANCATVYTNTYPEPIPSGLSVPGWAYLDVETNDNFDQSNARNNANLTESTAIPSPTSSSSSTQAASSTNPATSTKATSSKTTHLSVTPTSASTYITPTATEAPETSNVSATRENAIGGSIVGGLAALTIFFGLLYWYINRRRRIARIGVNLPSPTSSNNPSWHGQGPYMSQVPAPPASGAPPSTSSVGNQTPYLSTSSSADSVPAGDSHV